MTTLKQFEREQRGIKYVLKEMSLYLQGIFFGIVVGIVGTIILTGLAYLFLLVVSNVFLGRGL